jgi:predicted transcriptional regulator
MSRSDLPVIQVVYKGHTKRKYFVTWNGRKYAARDVTEMNRFAAFMKGNKAERRTIIEL